jgi:ssDNA-binding Zn-finger/Zn-ribbon topoisomerase 1
MKYCPECSTDYQDDADFCVKDGRALITRSRLCPHCANNVPLDAAECPQCHGSLSAQNLFKWSEEADSASSTMASDIKRMPKSSKLLSLVGILLAAIAGFLAGGQLQRNDLIQSMQDQAHEVQLKERKIKALEGQLAQVQQNAPANGQLAELERKLAEKQKELTEAQQKLTGASREAERLAAVKAAPRQTEPAAPPRVATRPVEPSPSARVAARPADPIPPASTAAAARQGGEPGSYETLRVTTVHEQPVNSSRVVAQIDRGTVITVVRSTGDWLEVRSKHGNPPGFIRRDDAMIVARAN